MDNANTAAAEVEKVYTVAAAGLSRLAAVIEKLNKRAVKLGCAPIAFEQVGEVYSKTIRDPLTHIEMVVRLVDVLLCGKQPGVNGWQLVATIAPVKADDGSVANIVNVVPGFQGIPVEYRTVKMTCQHCNTLRYRNDVALLQEISTGTYKQIGRNCLADFLRSGDADALLGYADIIESARNAFDEESGGLGSASADAVKLVELLTWTCSIVAKVGAYVSKKKADIEGIMPTSFIAREVIIGRGKEADKARVEFQPTEANVEKAKLVIDWCRNVLPGLVEQDEANDYLYNLKISTANSECLIKLIGVAASAVSAYDRHISQKAEAANKVISKHFGVVGERINFLKVTVLRITSFDGFYGTSYASTLLTEDGNVAVWLGSSPIQSHVESVKADGTVTYTAGTANVGDKVVISATVKAHDNYKGACQTKLSRCQTWTPAGIEAELAKQAKKVAREAKKASKATKAAAQAA
jgi:hypothetical protein